MKREFLEQLQVDGQPLPQQVVDAILEEHGKDLQSHQQSARDWEEKYTQAQQAFQKQKTDMEFGFLLQNAITAAGGRNAKAITALLDVEALSGSADPGAAVNEALTQLKKDSDYLFEAAPTPPPYARGTGAPAGAEASHPATLAGALREKFERK